MLSRKHILHGFGPGHKNAFEIVIFVASGFVILTGIEDSSQRSTFGAMCMEQG